MLRYLLPIMLILLLLAHIYSYESPTKYLIRRHVVKVEKVYYVIVEELAKKVVKGEIVSRVESSASLDLSRGSIPVPMVVVRSRGAPPPKYIRLIAYDNYTGTSWILGRHDEYVLNMSFKLLEVRGNCFMVKEDVHSINFNRSLWWTRIIACYGTEEAHTLLELRPVTTLLLGSKMLIPLPHEIIVKGGFNEEEPVIPPDIVPLILGQVIIVPPKSKENISLTLRIDKSLRYVTVEGLHKDYVTRLLMIKEHYKGFWHVRLKALNTLKTNFCRYRLEDIVKNFPKCYEPLIKLMYKVLCSRTKIVTLGYAAKALSRAIRSLVSYGAVDLGSYVNNTCSDYTIAFLFNARRGVCTHYASALALMLRILGFKARVATGLIRIAYVRINSSDTYIGFYAPHAWTEVVTKYGLLAFDPTPPTAQSLEELMGRGNYTYTRYREVEHTPYPGVRIRTGSGVRFRVLSFKDLEEAIIGAMLYLRSNIQYLVILIIALLILLMSGRIAVSFVKIVKIMRLSRLRNPTAMVMEVMKYIYSSLGISLPSNRTLRELINPIRGLLEPELSRRLVDLVRTFEGLRYGRRGSIDDLLSQAKMIIKRFKPP